MHTWMRAYFNLYRNISEFLWVINLPVKAIGWFFKLIFMITCICTLVLTVADICKLPRLRVQVPRECNTDYNVNLL